MSEAYDRSLVSDDVSTYERLAGATVGLAFLTFLAAIGALFGQIQVTDSIATLTIVDAFGGILLALGLGIGILGLLSVRSVYETEPSASSGLAVGLVFGFVWFLTAGFVATHTLGLGTIGWLLAIGFGLLVGLFTLVTPEDLGSTVPVAAFLAFCGATIVAGVISPGWAWTPAAFDASFPGTLVIPVLTLVNTLLAGWTAAKAHAGFGTRGRQNGVFLLISLNVFLVLAVLVVLVGFIAVKGADAVFQNLALGAGTVLIATVSILLLLTRRLRGRLRFETGTDAVTSFVSLGIACCLGLFALLPAAAIVTGRAFTHGAMTLRPTAAVGAVPGLVFLGLTAVVLRRSTEPWTPTDDTGNLVKRGLRAGGAVVLLGLFAEVALPIVGPLLETTVGVLVPSIDVVVDGLQTIAGILLTVFSVLVGGIASVLVVISVTHERTAGSDNPALPPVNNALLIVVGAFLALCLHVIMTGSAVGTSAIGIVDGGTISWPFVMNPSQGLGIQQGVMPAILGTVWIVAGAIVFAVPLAVGAAVFLTEYASDSLFTRSVDVATNGLWSTPSIVFGLFGLAFLVPRFGNSQSIFAAQLVLGFMLLPLVLITSREAMKTVPDEYRDASAALGVSKWQTIRSVVVPASMPGVITGVILGVGRIAGETAPLLLVLKGPVMPGVSPRVLSKFEFSLIFQPPFVHVSNPALLQKASALPYQLYAVITAGVGADSTFGWGTALVLLGVVLSFYAVGIASRRYFRRKLEQ